MNMFAIEIIIKINAFLLLRADFVNLKQKGKSTTMLEVLKLMVYIPIKSEQAFQSIIVIRS